MDNLSVFVDYINDYLIKENINMTKFSKRINIANSAVSKWFTLEYYPTIECAIKVADLFDCSLDYLFGLSETSKFTKSISNDSFIERFDKLCKSNSITACSLSKRCGFGDSMISKWRKGNFPRTETFIKLATYFNCSIDYLVGRSNN